MVLPTGSSAVKIKFSTEETPAWGNAGDGDGVGIGVGCGVLAGNVSGSAEGFSGAGSPSESTEGLSVAGGISVYAEELSVAGGIFVYAEELSGAGEIILWESVSVETAPPSGVGDTLPPVCAQLQSSRKNGISSIL